MTLPVGQTVGEWFAAALATPPTVRASFLDRHCPDPATRREVADLLAFDARAEAGGFLARGRATSPADAGRSVGPYLLLEEVGRGGMGTVHRAERVGDFRQEVAVKLGPPGTADSRLVERFRGERQVLAALDHPHIARLFDGGATPDGRPYFVMELVRGGRIDRHADARSLATRDRVRLFAAACRAVAYAHAQGVVHRDLKPGNILVSDAGVVKVVDFGLATRAGGGGPDASLTRTGDLLGTPGFLAPEQARGEGRAATPAADVFALGATLYALLTGRAPFRADTQWESVRLTLDADPVPPSRLAPGLPRDLESVCLKCLEKDPLRRYPTAAELADDLDRFARGEPTAARPVGRGQRVWRWARRHPLPAGLLAALVLVAVGSIASITALWLHAEGNAAQARKHAAAAEERTRTARQALRAYTSAATRLFRDPGQASPEERAELARALELYEGVLADVSGDPDEEDDAAYATLQLAGRMADLGEHAAAERACRRAITALRRLVDAHPDRGRFAHHLAEGSAQFGGLLQRTGRGDEGIELYREAVRAAEALAGRHPQVAEYTGMAASLRGNLGAMLHARGEDDEAEAHLRAAVAGCREALRRQPEHWPRYLYYTAAVSSHAQLLMARHQDVDRYLAVVLPLFDLADRTVRDRPADWPALLPPVIRGCRGLTATLWDRGRPDDARRRLARLAELAAEIARRRPADDVAAREHAYTLFDLGLATADETKSARSFRAAVRAVEPTDDRPPTPATLAARAVLLASCPVPAVRDPRRAVELARQAAVDDPGLPDGWQAVAVCLSEAGKYPEAVDALNAHQPGYGDRWAATEWGRMYHATWLAKTGNRPAARRELMAVDEELRKGGTPELRPLALRGRAWRLAGSDPPPLAPAAGPEGR